MISVIVVSVVVLVLFLLLYKELFYISLDERSARLAGVPVGIVNFIFTIMIGSDGFGCSTDSRRVDGIVDDGRSGSLCDAARKEL